MQITGPNIWRTVKNMKGQSNQGERDGNGIEEF